MHIWGNCSWVIYTRDNFNVKNNVIENTAFQLWNVVTTVVCQGPQGSSNSVRVHGTHHAVVFTAIIFFFHQKNQKRNPKESEAKSTKGKGAWMKSRGNQAQAFKNPFLAKSHRAHFLPPARSHDNMSEMQPFGKLVRDSVPRVLLGGYRMGTFC